MQKSPYNTYIQELCEKVNSKQTKVKKIVKKKKKIIKKYKKYSGKEIVHERNNTSTNYSVSI